MMPNKQKMIDYYENLLKKFGYHYRSLDWKDPNSQKIRYSVLFSIVKMFEGLKGFSILDLGCGLGHFYGWLKDTRFLKDYNIKYTGYDISPSLIFEAKKKHPEARFEVKDILEGYFLERFDFVFACGVFNIILSSVDEHEAFVKEMLLRMYESAILGVSVNFLSIAGESYALNDEKQNSVYYYYKPENMISFVRSFSQRYILRHDYHPSDFTLYLLKENI